MSLASQPSSTVAWCPTATSDGRAQPAQHAGHGAEHQQGGLVRRPAGPGEGLRGRALGVDVGPRRELPLPVPRSDPRHRLVQRHPGVAEREHRVAARGEPARGAQHPLAEGLALDRLPARQRQPVGRDGVEPAVDRRTGRHRLARDDVGGGDLDQVTLLASYDDPAVLPRLAHAQHVGHRRAAGGTRLAAHQAAYDDPPADHVRAQRRGGPVSIHGRVIVGHGWDTRLGRSPHPDRNPVGGFR